MSANDTYLFLDIDEANRFIDNILIPEETRRHKIDILESKDSGRVAVITPISNLRNRDDITDLMVAELKRLPVTARRDGISYHEAVTSDLVEALREVIGYPVGHQSMKHPLAILEEEGLAQYSKRDNLEPAVLTGKSYYWRIKLDKQKLPPKTKPRVKRRRKIN